MIFQNSLTKIIILKKINSDLGKDQCTFRKERKEKGQCQRILQRQDEC